MRAFTIPDALKSLVLSKRCVIFIGSGTSSGCYPTWPDLVNELCIQCKSHLRVDQNSSEKEFLDAAQDAKDSDENEYYRYLGTCFGKAINQVPPIYQVLLTLPFACYLTVNFDPLLAHSSRFAKLPCDAKVGMYPALDPREMARRSVHYLHGYIGEQSAPSRDTIVLSTKEFDAAYSANSNLMTMLVPCFANDPILFVGCRLREPTMQGVFRICKTQQDRRKKLIVEMRSAPSNPPPRFILLGERTVLKEDGSGSIDLEKSKEQMRDEEAFYRDMEIEPVWYPVAGTDHSSLRRALESLANVSEIVPAYGWERSPYDS